MPSFIGLQQSPARIPWNSSYTRTGEVLPRSMVTVTYEEVISTKCLNDDNENSVTSERASLDDKVPGSQMFELFLS